MCLLVESAVRNRNRLVLLDFLLGLVVVGGNVLRTLCERLSVEIVELQSAGPFLLPLTDQWDLMIVPLQAAVGCLRGARSGVPAWVSSFKHGLGKFEGRAYGRNGRGQRNSFTPAIFRLGSFRRTYLS